MAGSPADTVSLNTSHAAEHALLVKCDFYVRETRRREGSPAAQAHCDRGSFSLLSIADVEMNSVNGARQGSPALCI